MVLKIFTVHYLCHQAQAPSPTEPVGQLISDKGIDMEEFEMVVEEEPPRPASSKGDPGDQDEWGAEWAKELETEMKKRCCRMASWIQKSLWRRTAAQSPKAP